MKKILIITLFGNSNFGNKLQNYALQEYLTKMNNNFEISTQIIEYEKPLKNCILVLLWRIYNSFINSKKVLDDRTQKFIDFNNNYLNYSKDIYKMNQKKKITGYDYYIYGSDQIWNPFGTGKSDIYMGLLTDNNISYAASISSNYIPDKLKSKYIKSLSRFKAISVREYKGKEILDNLLDDKKVNVLIDPTMLLTEKDWIQIIKKPNINTRKKYILNYFLGDVSNEIKNEIKRISIENNCEIINLLNKDDPFYKSGPCEFLYLVKNAFLICTDSYHSAVFSFLFDRPFIIFERKTNAGNMYSRIETLIEMFGLKDRKYNGSSITKNNLNHDYKDAYNILNIERKKSRKFLEQSLNINK